MRNVQLESVNPLRLKLLVEVERRGSIAAAAEACEIGQPSASMHLRTLEAATGELLLHRNGRGSGLTDAGRIVAGHASRVLQTLDAMRRDLQSLELGEQGTLSIAASGVPSSVLLPTALRGFAARHPGVVVTVTTMPSEAVARVVARDEVDLGIAGEARASDRVLRETIFEDELIGIATRGRVSLSDGRAPLDELHRNILLVGPAGSSTRAVSERRLKGIGFRAGRVWELGSDEAIREAVRADLGVSFLSRWLVREEIDRGELVSFGIKGIDRMRRKLQIIRPSEHALSPSATAFATLLNEFLSSAGTWGA